MGVGRVYLVGAGPGDPELLTLRAARFLRQAQVIVHDRLVAEAALALGPKGCRRICVGKSPGRHTVPQEEINALLVDLARGGLRVVRLKGGDPFVFGRGGEEALALARAGVPFEVAPGVSSAIAGPAYAGIPVTHRAVARTVTIVTGHVDPSGPAPEGDYGYLARSRGTLVFLMGARCVGRIAGELMANGMAGKTPVAIIENATTSSQRVLRGDLLGAGGLAEKEEVSSPAVMVIGAAAALAGELSWFRGEETCGCSWAGHQEEGADERTRTLNDSLRAG